MGFQQFLGWGRYCDCFHIMHKRSSRAFTLSHNKFWKKRMRLNNKFPKVPLLSYVFSWKGTPWIYLCLKKVSLSHTIRLKKGLFSHMSFVKRGCVSYSLVCKRYSFEVEDPCIVHYMEYTLGQQFKLKCREMIISKQ